MLKPGTSRKRGLSIPRIADEAGAETMIGQEWAAPHPDQDLLPGFPLDFY